VNVLSPAKLCAPVVTTPLMLVVALGIVAVLLVPPTVIDKVGPAVVPLFQVKAVNNPEYAVAATGLPPEK